MHQLEEFNQFRNNIDKFIKEVFNYYNGRINTFNKATLIIDWAYRGGSRTLGVSKNPNIVVMYPSAIMECFRGYEKYYITETIIHELLHIDQIIDYIRYSCDETYKDSIEQAVELQTAIYIESNRHEISLICRGEMPDEVIRHLGYVRYAAYHRKRLVDHLNSMILELSNISISRTREIYNDLYDGLVIRPDKYTIAVIINGDRFIINNRGIIASLEEINKFFNQYFMIDARITNDVHYSHIEDKDGYVDYNIFINVISIKSMAIIRRRALK